MTPKNFFTYLQTLLKGMVWTGTSNKVFGNNVYIVTDTPMELLSRAQNPTCYIMDMGAALDEEHPNLVEQGFSLMLFVENNNSAYGEGVMMSANRTINTSQGAGLLDIEEEVITQLIKTITLSSVKIDLLEKSKAKSSVISGNRPNAHRTWSFNALLSLI